MFCSVNISHQHNDKLLFSLLNTSLRCYADITDSKKLYFQLPKLIFIKKDNENVQGWRQTVTWQQLLDKEKHYQLYFNLMPRSQQHFSLSTVYNQCHGTPKGLLVHGTTDLVYFLSKKQLFILVKIFLLLKVIFSYTIL